MSISVKIDARGVVSQLERLAQVTNNSVRLFGSIEELVEDAIQENFDAEGRPSWKERKDSLPHPILDKTGDLRGSIQVRVDSDGVRASTEMVYGAVHQFGLASKNIPARPYMTLTRQDIQGMADAIDDEIERAAGF